MWLQFGLGFGYRVLLPDIEAEVLMDLGRNEEALETIETYLRETPEDKLDVTSRAHICSTRSRLAPKFLPIEDVVALEQSGAGTTAVVWDIEDL